MRKEVGAGTCLQGQDGKSVAIDASVIDGVLRGVRGPSTLETEYLTDDLEDGMVRLFKAPQDDYPSSRSTEQRHLTTEELQEE